MTQEKRGFGSTDENKQRSIASPCAAISSPPFRAWASPSAVRSTSTQPVKRSSRFHWLWPWRSRISLDKDAAPRSTGSMAGGLARAEGERNVRLGAVWRARLGPWASKPL